jgi:transcription antitermination factor NusG
MLQIGDQVQSVAPSKLQGAEYPSPKWFLLTVRSRAEEKARAALEREGVASWYPTQVEWRARSQGRRRKVRHRVKLVPGYIVARFTGVPNWPMILHDSAVAEYVSSVCGYGDRAVALTDQEISSLSGIGRQVAAADVIGVGDLVTVSGGAVDGMMSHVTQIDGDVARLAIQLFAGVPVSVCLGRLKKSSCNSDRTYSNDKKVITASSA